MFFGIDTIIKEKLQPYFPQKKQSKYVYLDKDKKYVFCYKKHGIIEHKDCDYYEHNLECDKNENYWGRTHRDSSMSGTKYADDIAPILNECKYCLRKKRKVEKYRLSDEAREWLNVREINPSTTHTISTADIPGYEPPTIIADDGE